jgi:ATP-dependent DNA helicase Rep
MKLNARQSEAVHDVSGPCLVLAGAGSGKTRVITQKIEHLIRHCGYQGHQIVALTFTNKAAKEMKARATALLKQQARGLWISTFHTLGLDIIRKEHRTLKIKPNFSLFDSQDSLALIKDLCAPLQVDDKDKVQLIQNAISHWKNQKIQAHQLTQNSSDPFENLKATIYQQYSEHMRAYNALDFDDLILWPTLLLAQHEHIRRQWQQRIRYLLVDEYQDTNDIQYQFIQALVGERARFTVVGDDDQSIYSWRGARPENLAQLKQDFPQLRVIKLEQNYRSSGRILRVANTLIENNPHLFPKRLFSELGLGDPLKIIAAKTEEHEAERVVAEIIRHKFMHRTAYGEYAILYRSNHQARLFEKLLIANRLPYHLSGGMSFFDRSEIKDLMAHLKLLHNPDDDSAFLRAVQAPKRGIGPATLAKLGHLAQQWNQSLLATCLDTRLPHVLQGAARFALEAFGKNLVETEDAALRSDPLEALDHFFERIDFENHIHDTSPSPKANEMRLKNVKELLRWIKQMVDPNQDEPLPLKQAIQRLMLRDMLDRQEDEQANAQIHMMTLHASKGLEFPYVYMVGMEEGLLPHQNSIDTDSVEEERRLTYVGITRAQKQLTLTYCCTRRQFGEQNDTTPSRFLNELPEADIERENQQQKTKSEIQQSGQANIAHLRQMLKTD